MLYAVSETSRDSSHLLLIADHPEKCSIHLNYSQERYF